MLLDALNFIFIKVAFKRREKNPNIRLTDQQLCFKETQENSCEPQPRAELADWIQGQRFIAVT